GTGRSCWRPPSARADAWHAPAGTRSRSSWRELHCPVSVVLAVIVACLWSSVASRSRAVRSRPATKADGEGHVRDHHAAETMNRTQSHSVFAGTSRAIHGRRRQIPALHATPTKVKHARFPFRCCVASTLAG